MSAFKISTDHFRASASQNKVNLGDNYTLEITLYERGQAYTPAIGATFVLTCERTDHVSFTQQTGITFAENVVTVVLDTRCISSAGVTPCNLIVTNPTLGTTATFGFQLTVIDVVLSDQTTDDEYRDTMITALVNSTKAPYLNSTTNTFYEFDSTTGLMVDTEVKLGVHVEVPALSTSTGKVGDFSADENYLYICYATDSWIRIAKSAW